ncbi:MAG TPA: 1-acyl-sn-glycerol-3-phosphate acyltransferase, partial [Methylomirabilota bacterium]|nr:1-acyl-sn-glycerol-3-phosphate acyltransferase [Methylomirabilota bacterium]
ELTRAAIRNGWMDSGDLGYFADGELYVTGRSKDVIIKAGRNLYPQEIEDVVGGVAGVRRGCVAALGVPDPALGTERLVVVAETRATDAAVRERLRAAIVDRVVDAIGLPPDTVVVASPGAVLKTPSGKIRRAAIRQALVDGTLARRPPSGRRQWLRLLVEEATLAARAVARVVGAGGFALWVGVLLALTLPALWLAVAAGPGGRRADALVRRWARVVLGLAGCRPSVRGRPYLPAEPAVYVANHSSYLDSIVLFAALDVDVRFVAKRELLGWPVVGTVIRKVGHLTVERLDLSRSVADAARVTGALRAGQSVLFFPEGTFLLAPGLLPFRLGAFKAAVDTGRPVVPVAIRGTRDVLPAGTWRPRPGRTEVVVEPALRPRGEGWREMVRLRDEARAAIARALHARV